MPSRKSNQFNNLTTGKNLASVPKKIRKQKEIYDLLNQFHKTGFKNDYSQLMMGREISTRSSAGTEERTLEDKKIFDTIKAMREYSIPLKAHYNEDKDEKIILSEEQVAEIQRLVDKLENEGITPGEVLEIDVHEYIANNKKNDTNNDQ